MTSTYDHQATYSPEDNKLRLYFASRIPRDEWDELKVAGFSWTMKQASDMVATWTPEREDMALAMCGEIEDEDQPRAERSADRAERFGEYGDKREDEATATADRADAVGVIACQSAARADRLAKRAERLASKAGSQWGKAEYWTRRTAGVIRHALHLERADVRHRRIKGLEADLRRFQADVVPSETMEGVEAVQHYCGSAAVAKGHDMVGMFGQGRAKWPRSCKKAEGWTEHPWTEHPCNKRWREHYTLRLEYERQMLIGQGGTMADEADSIKPGGFIGSHRVEKVSRDKAGRLSGVWFRGPHPYREGEMSLHKIDAERIKPGSYRDATEEEAKAYAAELKARKAATPKGPPLINPTPEDAKALQEAWNAKKVADRKASHIRSGYPDSSHNKEELEKLAAIEPSPVNQAGYTMRAGPNGSCQTVDVCADWTVWHWRCNDKPVAFRVRTFSGGSDTLYAAPHVVIITDKPQKPLPALVPMVAEVEHATAE
jgi:hypothetical protein